MDQVARRVVYSAAARKALRGVTVYSRTHFQPARAAEYVQGLRRTCEDLGAEATRWPTWQTDGLRRVRYERHVVFYRVADTLVLVVAVFHEKQLPPSTR